ncbi:PREDICTED: tuftelin-interacting protein 11 [Ceratosolen solmsi marchali]|uniref:Tuftelin-interacting protein 11 n=1 Tax=Ceratosolen solmsi marchali TaxID=326594 RepID=A0AAJ7DYU3_9HYME|nr:PREDICTED: tuftelin-interacting protein 11 [Ceratosolen solmsi marchali]
MSDDEMEKFQISDYDLENEFNINRSRRKMSKKQQMLGIWASDSDEEEVRPSFSRAPKNYTAPVSFVPGGIQQAGQPKVKKEEVEEDEEDDDDNARIKNSSSESEEEKPKTRAAESYNFTLGTDIAGLRKKRAPLNPELMKTGVGNWEVHTKGIGAKLLLQMGFEPGKGLGKQLQGISAPVEAHLRKGRGAIGAYGPEKTAKVLDIKAKTEDGDLKKISKSRTSHWRKVDKNDKKKSNYSYRSVDEVLEDGRLRNNRKAPIINADIAKCKVTDMTTPEQRVFSGYHALGKRHLQPVEDLPTTDKKTTVNFSLPELQHNLDMIVDMCEQNIIQNDRRTKHLCNRVISLLAEKQTLLQIVDQHAQLIGTLENALAMINKLLDRNSEMTLKETAEAFKILQERHYEEYKAYDLGDLACSFIIPKIKEHLANWNPLSQSKLPLVLFKEWKDILEFGQMNQHTRSMSPYDQLIWNAWMPSIRGAIQSWVCRQPDNLIDLLEYWLPLLPSWIFDNLLDMVILPKLTLEVEEWNPLTDTVPIHTWIHPWLPLMKNRMDTLIYPIIRRKLGSALGAWHPSDRSARLMLQPWAAVFTKADMDAFLVKNILPKLQIALSELIINPHQQHLDQWNWVYEWKDLIPVQTMAALLDKLFFPKWLQVLGLWLNHSPNYEQVTNWYTGWKGMLNDKLLAEPIIKEHFRKALEMMNRAVSIPQGLQPGSVEQVSYLTSLERNQSQISQISQISQPRMERLAEAVRTASQIPQGFKDLVQRKCEERGILFMPLANRYREGKQVYKVGNVQAYIDSDILFVCHNGTTWLPTNLNTLLDTAEIN